MAPQAPIILVDNVFDRINLYPLAVLAAPVGSVVGREPQYAADYRRERTYWQASAASTGNYVSSDLGGGNTSLIDTVWIDRGHNLWGADIRIYSSNLDVNVGGVVFDATEFAVPAQGTVGGDPTVGWCVTEEGALYCFASGHIARRFHTLYVVTSLQPTITGLIMGKRVQLSSPAGWSSVRDEDAGERSERMEASLVPGYEGYDRTYSARSMALKLAYIGATEYDATIRGLRRTLFDVNQPAVMCYNYGTNPERAWLFRYRGKNWSSPMQKAYRTWSGDFFEVGPLVR
jgi:hypothetical protein